MRHQVSCVVTANGDVMPCVGVTIAIGNIREQKLADIIRNSEVINNLKNYRQMIKGECRTCEKAEECYGCRGAAYQLTGDYLASDPTCWRIAAGSGVRK
jgi:radical SAM protein with 4Fe4S-binding SPASM domain